MVELLIGLVLAMLLTTAMLVSYTFLVRSLIRSANQQQLETQSRRAMQILGQDMHMATDVQPASSSQLTLTVPKVDGQGNVIKDGNGNVITKVVTYTYDATAKTLTRTDPDFNSGTPRSLFPDADGHTNVSNFSFNYLDEHGVSLIPPLYPFCVKQIEISNFTVTCGVPIRGTLNYIAGTLTSYTGASARWVLRSKHLVNY
jgi:hypothetical protein